MHACPTCIHCSPFLYVALPTEHCLLIIKNGFSCYWKIGRLKVYNRGVYEHFAQTGSPAFTARWASPRKKARRWVYRAFVHWETETQPHRGPCHKWSCIAVVSEDKQWSPNHLLGSKHIQTLTTYKTRRWEPLCIYGWSQVWDKGKQQRSACRRVVLFNYQSTSAMLARACIRLSCGSSLRPCKHMTKRQINFINGW